ncbi:MAG TPA: ferredoxin, partial [Afipia sp.]|nr:ferredoxin [Afipia sp.]
MVQITVIQPSGTTSQLDVPEGWSLMQAAVKNGIDG